MVQLRRGKDLTNAALPEVKVTLAISQRMLSRSGEVHATLMADDMHSIRRFRDQQARTQNGACGEVWE